LRARRDSYDVRGQLCHNIEVEITGSSPPIVLVGAHYDSVFGAPGANDNGTAVRYPHYHSATDTPDKLDYDRFTLVVSGMQKVIEELASH